MSQAITDPQGMKKILSADLPRVSQRFPLFKLGSKRIVKGRLVFKTVHMDSRNVGRSLMRKKAKLSKLHGELLELYILYLRFENRNPEIQYCAL